MHSSSNVVYSNQKNVSFHFHVQASSNAKPSNEGCQYVIYKDSTVIETPYASAHLYAHWLNPQRMAYVYSRSFSSEGTYQIHGHVYSNDNTATFTAVDDPTKNWYNMQMVLYLDLTEPTVTSSSITYGNKLKFTLKDSFTGVAGYAVTTSSTEPTSWTTTGLEQYPKSPGEITDSIVRNAGTYYIWVKDRAGNTNKTTVTISKAKIAKPSFSNKTYNGESQSISAGTGYSFSEGTTSATDVGTYTTKAVLNSNYQWSDGSTADYSVSWKIDPKAVAVSWGSNTLTYNGSEQAPTASASSGITSETINITRTTGKNAGNYTSTASISSVSGGRGKVGNYTLTGNTKDFTINKAAGSISFATAIVNKTYLDTTYTQTVTKTGDGTVTYASSNTSVATVNPSTGVVTILGTGSVNIKATVTDGTNYTYNPNYAKYDLNVVYVVNEASSLIMKWKIPAGGANVKLPIPSNEANNYIVDWGDSSTVELVTNNGFYMHTYTNTSETEYTVKISGIVKSFGYRYSQAPTTTNAYSDYLTYTQYLTEVIRFGELSATGYGFAYCRNLTKVTADAKPETFASVPTMQYMFYGSDKLASIDLGNLDTTNVSSMDSMFYSCSSLVSAKFDEWKNAGGWNTQNVSSTRAMFDGCSKLEVVHLNGINTANVTTMESMFANCTKLRELDMSNCDTQNVETMYKMFYGCSSLVGDSASKFDVSNWNTSNVRIMESMFENCSSLTKLNVDNWNVGSVQNMRSLFRKCQSLNSLNVSDWKTISVMYMTSTFNSCSSLTTIDVSEWDTRSVTSMDYMFYNCSNLEYLNLDIWSTEGISSGANINYMFSDCTNLKDVLLGTRFARFDGNNMFHNCSSLRAVISLYNSVMTLSTTERADLSNGKLYVPSVEIEQAYEANRNFANAFGTGSEALSKVEPIVQVKGDNPKIVGFGEVYTINQDEGVYVAGYSNKTDISSNPYAIYGFSIDTTGFPIDTEVLGEYIISYKLNKNS